MAVSIKGRQARLRRMLLKKKLELEANLRQEIERRKEERDLFASTVRDEGDLGHFGFEQEIGRRRMNSCNEKLNRIHESLTRLNDTGYGICEECGAEIGERRLRVMPFAACCLKCQEALENDELPEEIPDWTEEMNQPRDL